MKLLWHRLLAKLLEQLLSSEGVTVLSELPATSNPPEIDVLLLRRNGLQWTESQRALLPDGIRDHDCAHHLLECKITESVTEQSLQQALTYDYLYRQSQGLSSTEVQTYVVSAKTPQANKLMAWGYTATEYPGVYVSTSPLIRRVMLLVLNELRDVPHNEYLRLFASRKQVRREAFRYLNGKPITQIWTVIYALQKAYELEGVDMSKEITVESLLEMGEEMRKQAVASASPEERLAGLGPEERLAGLGPEERLAGLGPEERLAGLGPEELRMLMKQIEIYLRKQQANDDNALPAE